MDSIIYFLNTLLVIILIIPNFPCSTADSSLKEGSSLTVKQVLISPTGDFSAGFFPIGDNAYCFSIWFSEPSCSRTRSISHNCTIVWMANRDYPVNGKKSKLWLQETGNLVLTDGGDKSIAWSTNTISLSSNTELILYDTGNLVLRNSEGLIIWQSFDSPTDTLLPLQPFTKNMQLVSPRTSTDFSSGFYKLLFNNDNLLRLLYDGPEVTSIYWPSPWIVSWATDNRYSYNSSRLAILDTLGKFTSSDKLSFLSADYGVRCQRRLTVDFDGNLRLYSRTQNTKPWEISWVAFSHPCQIHGACGPNSKCFYDTVSGRKCSCLPGYQRNNYADWSYGCKPKFNLSCANATKARENTHFLKITHMEFYGYESRVYAGYTLEMCKELCLSMCDCKGFQYRYIGDNLWGLFSVMNNLKPTLIPTVCYPKLALLNGYSSPSYDGQFYLKVEKSSLFSDKDDVSESGLNCSSEPRKQLGRIYINGDHNEKLQLLLWFAIVLGAVEIIGILLIWCFLNSFHQHDSNEATQGYGNVDITGFKRFSYSELKRATENFKWEIGRGAGGVVYKGTLSNNRVAAIKRLNIADDQGEAEFLAEVSSIGKLNHRNLIEMWGYCAEKKHRLLVYKYMKHGSLSENLSSKSLDWKKRFEIAIGTARGLAYLHEECLEWVLHCDVKPQNILLDSNYQPKVSDFGLSKLLNREDKNNPRFSRIRGTRGYMAPEWVLNLPITSKVDVYSYGIVMLEMVTGKNPATTKEAEEKEQTGMGLMAWVKQTKNEGESWIEEILDPKMEGEYDRNEVEMLVKLALQCVEEDKDSRPTMFKVVEILLQAPQNYL